MRDAITAKLQGVSGSLTEVGTTFTEMAAKTDVASAAGDALTASLDKELTTSLNLERAQISLTDATMRLAQAQSDLAKLSAEGTPSADALAEAQLRVAKAALAEQDAQLGLARANRSVAESTTLATAQAERSAATSERSSGALLGLVGGPLKLAAAAFLVAAGAGADMAYKYQAATVQMQNTAGITSEAAKAIGDAFLTTAGKSTFSAEKMMVAFGAVAGQLGAIKGSALTAAESLGFMQAATELADATGNDLKSTVSDLSQVMQSYSIPVNEAAAATDLLYNVSRATNTPISGVAGAVEKLKTQLGPLAPTLADTSTLLLDLNEHGLTGARGLMAVNAATTHLLGGSKATTAQLKEWGISIQDASGNFVGFESVIQQLQPHLAGLTEMQRLSAEKALFGAGASKKLDETIMAGIPGWKTAAAAVMDHNTVSTAAANHAQTLEGMMETLKATVSDMATRFGQYLTPYLVAFGNWIAGVGLPAVSAFADYIATKVVPALTQLAQWVVAHVMPSLMQLYQGFTQHLIPALQTFANWVAANVIPRLMELYQAVATHVVPTLIAFGGFILQYVIAPLAALAMTVLPPVISALTFLANHFEQFLPVLAGVTAGFVAFKVAAMASAAIGLVTAAVGALLPILAALSPELAVATASMFGLDVAMDANPVGAVVIAIAALVAGIVLLVTHLDWVREHLLLVEGALMLIMGPVGMVIGAVVAIVAKFDDLKNAAIWVKDHLKGIATVLGLILGPATIAATAIATVVVHFKDILSVAGTVKDKLGIVGTVLTGIVLPITTVISAISWLKDHFRDLGDAFNTAKDKLGPFGVILAGIMAPLTLVIGGITALVSHLGDIGNAIGWVGGKIGDGIGAIGDFATSVGASLGLISADATPVVDSFIKVSTAALTSGDKVAGAAQKMAAKVGQSYWAMQQAEMNYELQKRTDEASGAAKTVMLFQQMQQQYLATAQAQGMSGQAAITWANQQASIVVPGGQAAANTVQQLASKYHVSYQNMLDIIQANPSLLSGWNKDAIVSEQTAARMSSLTQAFANIGATISNAIGQALSFGGALNSIPSKGIGPGKAAGGPVAAGTAYPVGEQGPEWFVPTTSGFIIPHHESSSGAALVSSGGGGGTVIFDFRGSQMMSDHDMTKLADTIGGIWAKTTMPNAGKYTLRK